MHKKHQENPRELETLNPSCDAAFPLVTVVTVVKDNAIALRSTIQSIEQLTYPNIEYIIIDGKSTDGTVDVICEHKTLVNKWLSEPDNGIYDAMNKGASMASGNWLIFMNAGDRFFSPDCLTKIIENSPADTEVILAATQTIIDDEIETRRFIRLPLEPDELWRRMPTSHQSVLVQTKLQQLYPFDSTLKWCSDQKFLLRLFLKGSRFSKSSEILSIFDSSGGRARDPMLFIRERWQISKGATSFLRRLIQFGGETLHCKVWGAVVGPIRNIMPHPCIKWLRRLRNTAGT